MKTLAALIGENEDWLVDRLISHVVRRGATDFTSTLREAWRAAICGVSDPIIQAISSADGISDAEAALEEARRSITTFGTEQAIRHRSRGISLPDFLGILSCERRTYLELIDESPLEMADAKRLRGYVLELFEQMEFVLCREWTVTPASERLRDLQQMNKLLTNEKNKYLTIFESIQEPVILLDANHHPTHLNHAAHRLFCGAVAPGASYYGASNSPLLNAQVTTMLEGASEVGYDAVVETLSGPREFNVNIQKMLDVSHKFDGTVIILNDVSEYKRALRRAEAADHAKSTFLAAMSHEIRTPIAGVLGLARLLRDTELSSDQFRYVDGIISSGELLAGVVGEILDFSQAEVGGRVPVPENFDVAGLVRQVLMVVDRQAAEKGLRLVTQIAPEVATRLRGDTSMIRQVLLNLAHNAVKFTETGEVTVRVAPLETAQVGSGWIRFEVLDTGVGLPDGPSAWLFDPFTQHDGRGDALKGGVGLGLAICRKIVSSLGGDIACSNIPEGGSVFQVDLPLEPAISDTEYEHVATPSQPDGARILVVDDDEVNRAVAKGFLEKLGHIATSVSSAPEALARLQSEAFDLVLSDNRMPGVSGLDLLAQLRAVQSGPNAGIPVVIVTASVGDIRAETSGALAPDGVLAKPYGTQDLSLAIQHLLPDTSAIDAHTIAPDPKTEQRSDTDLSTLSQHMAHLGPERSQRIIEAFTASAPVRIQALHEGVANRDWPEVSSAAHALAGASGILGLNDISQWAREIESRADSGDETLSRDDVARLEDQLLAVRTKLAELSSSGWRAQP